LSEPWTKDEEDELVVSSPPPEGGDVSDTGVVAARDVEVEGVVLDVPGVVVV